MDIDRLREMLDAVIADHDGDAESVAARAFVSAGHLRRVVRSRAGESPGALRRRVLLERAAWDLRRGTSVTETAWASGFDSLEGFSRAFSRAHGKPPSRASELDSIHLPAPNGIHFHAPAALWVAADTTETTMDMTAVLAEHDLADTTALLKVAARTDPGQLVADRIEGLRVLPFDSDDVTALELLRTQVHTKEVWLAAIHGRDGVPERGEPDLALLTTRHHDVAGQWRAWVREVTEANSWDDSIIDALCDPPERFSQGGILAHVLTYAAQRRALIRHLLADSVDVGTGDPLVWVRAQ